MKPALELPVAPQLDEDNLVQKQADEVEGLRHVCRFFRCVGHGVCVVSTE